MAWRIHVTKEPEDEATRSLKAMPEKGSGFAAAVGCAANANNDFLLSNLC